MRTGTAYYDSSDQVIDHARTNGFPSRVGPPQLSHSLPPGNYPEDSKPPPGGFFAEHAPVLRAVPDSSSGDRYIVHIPITAPDYFAARLIAAPLARLAGKAGSGVDVGETTVSTEEDQSRRDRVFCNRMIGEGEAQGRCPQLAEHAGECGPFPRTQSGGGANEPGACP